MANKLINNQPENPMGDGEIPWHAPLLPGLESFPTGLDTIYGMVLGAAMHLWGRKHLEGCILEIVKLEMQIYPLKSLKTAGIFNLGTSGCVFAARRGLAACPRFMATTLCPTSPLQRAQMGTLACEADS